MKSLLIVLGFSLSLNSFANKLDQELSQYIKQFRFSSVGGKPSKEAGLFELGKKIFFDKRLSLSGDISCSDCHRPSMGSGDGLPLSIGTGGVGIDLDRKQGKGKVVRRNAPHLFNKGHKDFKFMFHDGRVSFNSRRKTFVTPNKDINGRRPLLEEVVQEILPEGSLAAQALFPIASAVEMAGPLFERHSATEIWQLVEDKMNSIQEYKTIFNEVFHRETVHIGHIGRALAHFQKIEFYYGDTPWDRYLEGDKHALSDAAKRGAIIFSTKASCTNCHEGKHLTNFKFENVLIPDLAGDLDQDLDQGRFEATQKDKDRFRFLTPPLRGICETAPYFHNGAYSTLREVVEHYLKPETSFKKFKVDQLNLIYKKNYTQKLVRLVDGEILHHKSSALPSLLPLSKKEVDELIVFLKSLCQ